MGHKQETIRPRLTLAASSAPGDSVTARDLAGIDMTQIPQELAGQVPTQPTPWRRGTCSPAMETPEGPQAIFFGTREEMHATHPGGGVAINASQTLWLVRCAEA